MVVSVIPGRVRIRKPPFQVSELGVAVEKDLKRQKGVVSVDIRHRSGSILVYFDSQVTTVEQIESCVNRSLAKTDHPALGKEHHRSGVPQRKKRPGKRYYNLMLASLLASMSGIVIDSKKIHTQAGILFLGLAGKHAFHFKNRMWR